MNEIITSAPASLAGGEPTALDEILASSAKRRETSGFQSCISGFQSSI